MCRRRRGGRRDRVILIVVGPVCWGRCFVGLESELSRLGPNWSELVSRSV